jgi:hypothetical protein
VSVRLDGADLPRNRCEALSVSVNGDSAQAVWTGFGPGKPSLRLKISRNAVTQVKGRLEISFSMADEQPLAFATLAVRID